MREITKGSTDISLYFFIRDNSDHTAKTGLVYNSSGAKAYYVREGGNSTSITLVTQTVDGTHTDGGFVEVDATNMPGLYRFDPPDACFVTGVDFVMIQLSFTGVFTNSMPIQLITFNDFKADITTLSTFDASSDEVDIGKVRGATVTTINDFKADVSSIIAKLPTNNIADETLLEALIKQNRIYNVSLELVAASTENATRKVAVGKLDRIIYKIKNDGDSDWNSPVSTGTLFAWYDTLGDDDPHWMKESE